MAREGAIYRNAYTPAPVCTPARLSMITGQYSTRHYAYNIGCGPTPVLEAAGCPAPDYHQGISQLPVLRGETRSVRDWAVVDHLSNAPRLHQQTLVWDGWKGVFYQHADYGELYDMQADPDQYQNRWDDPAAQERKMRMMQKLIRINMVRVGKMPPRVRHA